MSVDKTEMDRLNNVWQEALRAHWAHDAKRREREAELMKEVRAKLDAELGAEWNAIIKAEVDARQAYDAEAARVREIESRENLPYPLGTVLVEWGHRGWSPMSGETGRKAVVEIYKQGDPLSQTVRYSRPDVGELILRILKKDGSRGLAVERHWNVKNWLPEGQKPPVK